MDPLKIAGTRLSQCILFGVLPFCRVSIPEYNLLYRLFCVFPLAAPSSPINLTFPPGGVLNDSITLTWLPPQHPNGVVQLYHLRLLSSGVSFFVNTTTTTIVLSDLTPGTQYNFSVRAFTVAFGPFSVPLLIHTADGEHTCNTVKGGHVCLNAVFLVFLRTHPVPLVPQSISALSTGPTTVLVIWMASTVIFREYKNT